jgi:uncharacterized membrane protein YidH (DUF202 family)
MVRTAVGVIGFGFAIAQYTNEGTQTPVVAIAIVLTFIGLFACYYATSSSRDMTT